MTEKIHPDDDHDRENDLQKRTREVAYMLWESAGRHHGRALDYWLAAESEVLTLARTGGERMPDSSASTSPDETPEQTKKQATIPDADTARKPCEDEKP
jgi:hypothetical protein